MRTEIKIYEGDKNYNLNFTLQDNSGTAIDITGASLQFKAQKAGDTALAVDRAMQIDTGASGTCHYQVQDGDFTEGNYHAEIEVTFSSSEIATFGDIIIRVKGDLPK